MADGSQSLREASLRVQERFVSIQGEGALVGTPSTFLRVSGCNLRCVWCDTPRTSWAPQGERLSVEDLVESCAAGPRHVVLTGGEPLLFPATVELTRRLRAAGHHLTIETAGSVAQPGVQADLMSISPKLSHSTPWRRAPKLAARHERDRIDLGVLTSLTNEFAWQLKFVVRRSAEGLVADLAEIDELVADLKISGEARTRVLLMPEGIVDAELRAGYLALRSACTERGYRLGLRLHIHMFGHTPGT